MQTINGLSLYLLISTHLYFVCEWLKRSLIVPLEMHHYNECVIFFKQYLTKKDLYNVCDFLNYQSNFTLFVKNMVYMLLCIYALMRVFFKPPLVEMYLYWFVAYASAIVFSLLGRFKPFCFSLTSHSTYTNTQIIICIIMGSCVFILLAWQLYLRRIRYKLLVGPCVLYAFIFVLFSTVTNSISFHFHHALCTGFLSLCFTDFTSRMNRCVHAFCMGIFIQGINYYYIEEIFLFNIEYVPPPTFLYVTWLCILFTIGGLCVWKTIMFVQQCRPTTIEPADVLYMEIPLLVPPPEEIVNSSL